MPNIAWAQAAAISPNTVAGVPTVGFHGSIAGTSTNYSGGLFGPFLQFYGGLVGVPGGVVTFTFDWTPETSAGIPDVGGSYNVGGGSSNGFRIYYNANPPQKGTLVIRGFVDGVECDNYLRAIVATSGDLYGLFTFEEVGPAGPTPGFWTQFVNAYEVP